jgi:uncharacterized protein YidB (DUF937 family)
MGLLDSLLGSVLGGGGNDKNQMLIKLVMGLLSGQGSPGGGQGASGLAGLVGQFQKAGLGDAVNSWISTGANQPVNGAQVQQALGADQIQQFAQQTGMGGGQVSDLLAQLLPQVIDKVTPSGSVPPQNDLQGMLGGLLGQLGGQR